MNLIVGSDAVNCLMQVTRNASCVNTNLQFTGTQPEDLSFSYDGTSESDYLARERLVNVFLGPYAPWGTSLNRPPWPSPPPASPPPDVPLHGERCQEHSISNACVARAQPSVRESGHLL